MSTHDPKEVQMFLSSKGKGKFGHTSGKGFGRKGNPKGKGGKPMLCHECNSPDHLVRDCPVRRQQKGGGKGGGFSMGAAALVSDAPLGSVEDFAPWEEVDQDATGIELSDLLNEHRQ